MMFYVNKFAHFRFDLVVGYMRFAEVVNNHRCGTGEMFWEYRRIETVESQRVLKG